MDITSEEPEISMMQKPIDEKEDTSIQNQAINDTEKEQMIEIEQQYPKSIDVSGEYIEYDTLAQYGYQLKNEKFVQIDIDAPFEYELYKNKEDNQKRYETIGKLLDKEIYTLLETECHLTRIIIPVDAKKNEPTSFFFMSTDALTQEYLMIIIHGTGVVRAGQWSRKLIMNEGLEIGSQIPYIKRAMSLNYGVIVTNTNYNTVESHRSMRNRSLRPIRGSESAAEHGSYVWKHFVEKSKAKHLAIMAHSYGGAVVLHLAHEYKKDFKQRVFAIALTDSPMHDYAIGCESSVCKILKPKTINWVTDTSPLNTDLGESECGHLLSAGHTIHEWTSHSAFDAIFDFFDSKRKELEPSVQNKKNEVQMNVNDDDDSNENKIPVQNKKKKT
ncbi:unnamed protein product [Didymodactylos carnosus]|uniref:Arb2 domain-containing protein n=1 Tax=Didymodactylos carnosus TaxID=1234261 RepID=A0A814IEM0_9BILA|nr:unnamed protein product [Didymodactylos carnosus]CAF1022278.1 unnamed protein product [Didymodactylos carnosus]CAF3762956.1 unnamed protein product [Didymodactylos carnosus]CAF3793518.1 unnamed protein product [Didymodactylos carnosus]